MDRSITVVKAGVFLSAALGVLALCFVAARKSGSFGPPQPLHGVWEVVEFERDERVVPPLATDPSRWKQVFITRAGDFVGVAIRPMTGDDDERRAELVPDVRRMTLQEIPTAEKTAVVLTYEEPGVLVLTGTIDGKPLRVKPRQVPPERFRLVNRGFHWINETPYHR